MDKFIQWLKDIYHPVRDWLMGWTNLDAQGAKITICTVFALVVAIIIFLIVFFSVRGAKKRKARKLEASNVQEPAKEEKVEEF